MSLFPDAPAPSPEATDFDVRVEQFLTRWHWRGDRAVVKAELLELIDRQRSDGIAMVCWHAGCQEIR